MEQELGVSAHRNATTRTHLPLHRELCHPAHQCPSQGRPSGRTAKPPRQTEYSAQCQLGRCEGYLAEPNTQTQRLECCSAWTAPSSAYTIRTMQTATTHREPITIGSSIALVWGICGRAIPGCRSAPDARRIGWQMHGHPQAQDEFQMRCTALRRRAGSAWCHWCVFGEGGGKASRQASMIEATPQEKHTPATDSRTEVKLLLLEERDSPAER
jgi:hypothetical protein